MHEIELYLQLDLKPSSTTEIYYHYYFYVNIYKICKCSKTLGHGSI